MVTKNVAPLFYFNVTDKHKVNLYNDICRGITIFLVVRFLLKRTFNDKDWQLMVFHNIVGFFTYQIIINRFDFEKLLGPYYGVFEDIVKSFTIITVSTFLSNSLEGKKTFTQEFFTDMLKVLGGVILYHSLIQKHLRKFLVTFTGNTKYAVLVEDWIENIVIFVVSQFFSEKSLMDKEWLNDTLYYILGIGVYHSLIRHIIQ